MRLILVGVLLMAQSSGDSDKTLESLRSNQTVSQVSLLMAEDICTDHPKESMVWVLDYRTHIWMNVTCKDLARAEKK